MSVSSITSGNPLALFRGLDIRLTEDGEAQAPAAAQSSTRKNAYSAEPASASALAGALKGVMDDLGLSAKDNISFQTLMVYRDKLQAEFTDDVRLGLLAAGVDKDVEFRVAPGVDGRGIRVITDHPDKEKIEAFFKENPELAQTFEQIQSLNKMEEVRKSRHIDVNAIRDRIRLESMTAWFSANQSFMAFSEQGAAYYSGINAIA